MDIRNHPYKTFDEQLNEIRKKNIIIDDEDVANEAIRSFSYYSIINGYKDLFLDKSRSTASQEKCVPGTTFSMLYTVHWIDITLSGILFKYTLSVEKKLKTQIANLVSELYTIEEDRYLDKINYSQAKHHRGKLRELIKNIDDSKDRDISAIHYYKAEKNLPPWIAAKSISFGATIIWYSILRQNDKQKIILEHIPKCSKLTNQEMLDFFDIIIDQVYQYRNLTAHGNRSFSLELPKPIKIIFLQKLELTQFFKEGDIFHKNDLYSLILSIIILTNDPFVVENMINELEIFFIKYSDPNLLFSGKDIFELFNLPKDIIYRLKQLFSFKFNKEIQ